MVTVQVPIGYMEQQRPDYCKRISLSNLWNVNAIVKSLSPRIGALPIPEQEHRLFIPDLLDRIFSSVRVVPSFNAEEH